MNQAMITYHRLNNNSVIAEITPDSPLIKSSEEILELMVNAGYMNCGVMIIHRQTLHNDFFDLRTGLAGEILQKFSNYRMRLYIVGELSGFKSKSLSDFIRESNRTGNIRFVRTLEEALYEPREK
jgi:hypothetical protein